MRIPEVFRAGVMQAQTNSLRLRSTSSPNHGKT
jgi:hypothetical protein